MHWMDEIVESCDQLRAERDRYREALEQIRRAAFDAQLAPGAPGFLIAFCLDTIHTAAEALDDR